MPGVSPDSTLAFGSEFVDYVTPIFIESGLRTSTLRNKVQAVMIPLIKAYPDTEVNRRPYSLAGVIVVAVHGLISAREDTQRTIQAFFWARSFL